MPSVASLFKKRRFVLDNQNRYTPAQIRYIICIYHLAQHDDGVKNLDIATALGFSKPSVHNMLKYLADIGIVQKETFGLAYLTDNGRTIAQKYATCYAVLSQKITDICGSDAASENAICGLLADMPYDRLNELYNSKNNEKR